MNTIVLNTKEIKAAVQTYLECIPEDVGGCIEFVEGWQKAEVKLTRNGGSAERECHITMKNGSWRVHLSVNVPDGHNVWANAAGDSLPHVIQDAFTGLYERILSVIGEVV